MDGTARPSPRRRIAIVVLSILLYVATVSVGFFHGFADSLQTWQGFYTLVLPNSIELENIDKALRDGGVRGVLSASSVSLDLASFDGEAHRISLPRAKGLLPQDPRRSPWIDALPGFFRDGEDRYHVLYIPQHETIATLMLRLDRALSPLGSEWSLVEWKPQDRITMFVLLGTLALVLVILARGKRLAVFGAVIPWIMVAAGFGPRLFPFFALSLLHFVLVNEKVLQALNRFVHEAGPRHYFWELIHKPRRAFHALKSMLPFLRGTGLLGNLSLYWISVLALVIVSILSGEAAGVGGLLLLFGAGWPSVWIWATYVYTRQMERIEHPLFFPVPILGKLRPPSRPALGIVLPLAVASLLIPLAFFLLSNPGLGVSVPVPDGSIGPGSQSLHDLKIYADQGVAGNPSGLPNLAMAVAHRLQQERIAWQKIRIPLDMTFPQEGMVISVKDAEGKDSPRLVVNNAWFESWRQKVPQTSIEHMLLVQGNAYGLAYSSKHRVYSADFWSLVGLAAFGLSCVPLFLPLGSGGRAQKNRRPILWGKKTPA